MRVPGHRSRRRARRPHLLLRALRLRGGRARSSRSRVSSPRRRASAMHHRALACDYDGTLASDGRVSGATWGALERLVLAGAKLVLVTGRRLDDLLRLVSRLELFSRVVAENGAVLYCPQEEEVRRLASPPPAAVIEALRAHGVSPLGLGEVVIGTV